VTAARRNRELDDVAAGERASDRHRAAHRTAPMGGSNRLLSVEELAAYLGVPKKTVYGCWRQWGLRGTDSAITMLLSAVHCAPVDQP